MKFFIGKLRTGLCLGLALIPNSGWCDSLVTDEQNVGSKDLRGTDTEPDEKSAVGKSRPEIDPESAQGSEKENQFNRSGTFGIFYSGEFGQTGSNFNATAIGSSVGV